ncbi:hypothetical protein ACH42_05755 [Endozoicomonas sp. (ex Bugula neritina AB1)]|nr:hypothetical protein ACH42_05755 [Endozoicomonas sp. (ex Bugula neritina AB1)]
MDIEFTDNSSEEDIEVICNGLNDYNKKEFKGAEERKLAFYLKDKSRSIIGGLTAKTAFSIIYVKYFWVSEAVRGKGYGTELLNELEQYATQHGVERILLDTYSFQAPLFYEKSGFIEVSRLHDYPKKGVDKIFYSKNISYTHRL